MHLKYQPREVVDSAFSETTTTKSEDGASSERARELVFFFLKKISVPRLSFFFHSISLSLVVSFC